MSTVQSYGLPAEVVKEITSNDRNLAELLPYELLTVFSLSPGAHSYCGQHKDTSRVEVQGG